jgi:hypothetical protein
MSDFDGASQTFLSWLKQSGAEMSPKIALEDLRNKDAGRGVGMSAYPSFTYLVILIIQIYHGRKWNTDS